MALVGTPAPTFTADAALNGDVVSFDLEAQRGKWVCLFFYPLDFTFVCPTELVAFNDAAEKFAALNTTLAAVSVDSVHTHLAWLRTPRSEAGVGELAYPLISDLGKDIAAAYGVLSGPVALRGLFLIDPEGTVQHATINNLSVGRNVNEVLRTLEAFQFTVEHGEVCPANWSKGDSGMAATLDGVKQTIG